MKLFIKLEKADLFHDKMRILYGKYYWVSYSAKIWQYPKLSTIQLQFLNTGYSEIRIIKLR